MNELTVQRAECGDMAELVRLRLAYLNEDHGCLDQDTETKIIQSLPAYFHRHLNRDLFAYIIKDNETVISCAFLLCVEKPMSPSFINGKTGTVLNVYTDPSYRRKGYSTRVMKRLIEEAEEMNLSVIELKATEDGYPLYASLGFKEDHSYTEMKYRF